MTNKSDNFHNNLHVTNKYPNLHDIWNKEYKNLKHLQSSLNRCCTTIQRQQTWVYIYRAWKGHHFWMRNNAGRADHVWKQKLSIYF